MLNSRWEENQISILNFPTTKYDILYVDPPWPVKKIQRRVRPNQVDMDYPVMSLEELRSLPIPSISEYDSTLWLWTTQKMLPEALKLMEYWGFKYSRTITWDKGNGMCINGFHNRTELLLFGYKGKLAAFPKRHAFPTLISARSKRHSEKPQIFRDLISLFGVKKIELFARVKDENWDVWGNEV